MPRRDPLVEPSATPPDLDADSDWRWGVEAVLRQALMEVENGGHLGLMIIRLKRALAAAERQRDHRYGEGPEHG